MLAIDRFRAREHRIALREKNMKRVFWLVAVSGFAIGSPALAENRSIDGSGNNIANTSMGAAGSLLLRGSAGCQYSDGTGAMMNRPNPRELTNALSAQTPGGLGNARGLSSMTWQWGQFMDHDYALVNEGTTESADFAVPIGDPTFDPFSTGTAVMPFFRSDYVGGTSPADPRQHANEITHWLDGSQVYGSDIVRANTLRSFAGGRLATSANDMLPFNTTGLNNAPDNNAMFHIAGDIRSNEQTGLTSMHTLFLREHNRLADEYSAANPGASDEDIYQHARKIVGAEIQAITYNEWLPAVMGGNVLDPYAGYNPSVDGRMATEFTSAAFRIGHTLLNDELVRLGPGNTPFAGGNLNLFQSFFNPSSLTTSDELDAVFRGLAYQEANEVDTQAIDSVRNLLFGGTDGRDLIGLNLQRGRDHGIPDYNTLRQEYGLPALTTFSQITSDTALASALETAYAGDINNIDAWIGLFAEDHMYGSLGETVATIFMDQFERLRDADRFFYLNDGDLSSNDLDFLNSLRLSDIIRLNTGASEVQDNVFFVVPAPSALALLGMGGLVGVRRRRNNT